MSESNHQYKTTKKIHFVLTVTSTKLASTWPLVSASTSSIVMVNTTLPTVVFQNKLVLKNGPILVRGGYKEFGANYPKHMFVKCSFDAQSSFTELVETKTKTLGANLIFVKSYRFDKYHCYISPSCIIFSNCLI